MRPSLWFVTPAYRRYKVSEVCFAQRAWAIQRLRELGIDATCVVIADDRNLDLAAAHGFACVETDNYWLGRKFNDGYHYAADEGVDFVVPIGSDSWIDPGFFAALHDVKPRTVVYSRNYAMVHGDGDRLGQLVVDYDGGVAMALPTEMLAPMRYRPCGELLQKGCDSSTMQSIRDAGGPVHWQISERHRLEVATLRTKPQISDYDKLLGRWGVSETSSPFETLATVYPAELVDQARRLYDRKAVTV